MLRAHGVMRYGSVMVTVRHILSSRSPNILVYCVTIQAHCMVALQKAMLVHQEVLSGKTWEDFLGKRFLDKREG